jgi:drug/metabolite transporter (DMT)-like permease
MAVEGASGAAETLPRHDQGYHRSVGSSAWLGFALLAPLLWSASNLIDERLVRTSTLRPWTLVTIAGAFASVPAFLLFGRWYWPGWATVSLALGTGAVSVLLLFPYLTALAQESAARVVLMWNLSPVVVLWMAATVLGERVPALAAAAVFLLVASSLVAAYRGEPLQPWSSATGWMLLASVALAADSVMEKAVYQRLPFLTGLAWISAGSLLTTGSIVALASESRSHLRDAVSARLGGVVLLNEGLSLVAAWSLSFATSRGPVGIVAAVGGLQPVFVLLFQGATRRERLTRLDLMRLVGASALAVGGLRLLNSVT